MKVSVIVPVFNVKKYLKECLDSILSQTIDEIEIICGDGGSTDGSLEILEEYSQKYPNLKYITKERSGYGESVNDCVKMAQGEYIGLVESDDLVKEDMFEELYAIAKKNDLDWIKGNVIFFYSNEKDNRVEKIAADCEYGKVLYPQEEYGPYRSGLRTWAGIYKKSFLIDNDIFHNETPGGSYQDVGFYLKCLYFAKKVYFVDKPYYMWRQDNPNSSIHYDSKKLVDKSFSEWKLNQEYLIEKNLDKRAVASYNYRKFLSYMWTIDMAEGEVKQYAIEVAHSELKKAYDEGDIDERFFYKNQWESFISFISKSPKYHIKKENSVIHKIKTKIYAMLQK